MRGRLRAHLALARVSNSPTVVSNVLAGAALGGALTLNWALLAVAAAMVLFYTAGMYLNDLLDYEIDRRERPGRPLPSGAVSRAEALRVTVGMFVLGLLLLAPLGWSVLLAGLVLVGLIVVYDAWHKTNPLSPLFMALTRVMVYLTAFLAFAGTLGPRVLVWSALLGLYIAGLTYIAKTEHQPLALRYWPVVLLLLPAAYLALQAPDALGWLLIAVFTGWTLLSLRPVFRGERRAFGRVIAALIAGVSLLDALVLADADVPLLIPVALLAFTSTLYLQRFIKGT